MVGIDPARNGRETRSRIGFCFSDPDAQLVMPTASEDVALSLRRQHRNLAPARKHLRV